MAQWAHHRGIAVEVKNDGHHWLFRRGDRVCEWWPSSGRFVAQRRYKKPRKIYDVDQAKEALGKALLSGRTD